MNPREREILEILRKNPLISQQELAELLGIQRSSVAGYIMGLTRAGFIQGRGYILKESKALLVIGGANCDIQGRSSASYTPEESNPGFVEVTPGGVGRNIAENLARLGVPVIFLSALGDDSNGRFLLEETRKAGVDLSHVKISSRYPTSTYLSLCDERGDLRGAVSDMSVTEEITPEYIQEKRHLMEGVRGILVDANIPEETLAYLGDVMPDVPLFADPVSEAKARRLLPLCHRIHTVKPNLREAAQLLERPDEKDPRALMTGLLEAGMNRVFLSLGREGTLCGSKKEGFQQENPRVKVTSVNGAGDAYLAGAVAGWYRGYTMREAAEVGKNAAARTLQCEKSVDPALTWEGIQRTGGLYG